MALKPILLTGQSIAEWQEPPHPLGVLAPSPRVAANDPIEARGGAFLHTPAVRDGAGALILAWCFVNQNIIDALVTKFVAGRAVNLWQIHPREGLYKFDSFTLCVGSDTDPTALVCVGGYHAAISDAGRITGVARRDIAGACTPARSGGGGGGGLPALPGPNPVAHFGDVPAGSAIFEAVQGLADLGISSGYGDGTFRPGANLTRGQQASLLWRTLGWLLGR